MENILLEECLSFDIAMMEADNVLIESMPDDLYTESAKNPIADWFKTLKDKIAQFIQNAIEKVMLMSIQFSQKILDKLIVDLNNDPKFKNKKVSFPDSTKLNKLTDETLKKVDKAKTKDELESTMDKYRKQRKAILAGSAAAITATAGTAFVLFRKKQAETSKYLRKLENESQELLDKKEAELKEANKQIHDLKFAADMAQFDHKDEVKYAKDQSNVYKKYAFKATDALYDIKKQAASCISEISKNSASDSVSIINSFRKSINEIVSEFGAGRIEYEADPSKKFHIKGETSAYNDLVQHAKDAGEK